MKLWVIGNGFDLYHGLPTSYEAFFEFISKKPNNAHMIEFLQTVVGNTVNDTSEFWNNFEGRLGDIDISKLNNFRNQHNLRGQFWLEYVKRLRKEFCAWARSISLHQVDHATILNCFSNDDFFITFNYTDTLERVYGINKKHILHIHGEATNENSIIFGHNKHPKRLSSPDEYDYLCATYKNTTKIYENNKSFFQILSDKQFSDVYVLGCSLAAVDDSYFRHLSSSLRKCLWYFSYYTSDERCRIETKATEYKLPKSRVGFITINSLMQPNKP